MDETPKEATSRASAGSSAKRPSSARSKPRASGAKKPKGVVCNVPFCPFCLAVTTAQDARPEITEHLLGAARELVLAIRAMVDARAEAVTGSSPLEHIDIA